MIGIAIEAIALLVLAACALRKEEECYVEVNGGKKPCTKDIVKQSPECVDRDGDRVCDDKDKCPDQPHIGSPDGCPPACEQDRDADGLNDCADSCPETPGVQDASGCTDASYTINVDYYRLMQARSSYQEIDANFPCAHLVRGTSNGAAIAWSNGTELKIADTTFVHESAGDINLCSLRHPIAQDSMQRYTLLWHRGGSGERSELIFQRFAASGASIGNVVSVDSFPLSNLGPRGDFKIAALDLFPNDDALVAWVNRDKVHAQIFSVNGSASDRMLVNERSIHVERNINPDVSVASDGSAAFVWQEGRGDNGPIQSARFAAGLDPARRQLSIVAALGNAPAVALNQSTAIYLWNNNGAQLKAEEWPMPQQLSEAGTGDVVDPSIILDDQNRLTASWLTMRDDRNGYRLHLQEFPNVASARTENRVAPALIDDAVTPGWGSFAANRSFSSVGLLYPSVAPHSWQFLELHWGGSESPPSGPALSFRPNPIVMENERVALHLCNRGVAPLTVEWELSSGFLLSSETVYRSQGEERIAPLVCHVRTLTSEGSSARGEITLKTNDPNNSEIAIPISTH